MTSPLEKQLGDLKTMVYDLVRRVNLTETLIAEYHDIIGYALTFHSLSINDQETLLTLSSLEEKIDKLSKIIHQRGFDKLDNLVNAVTTTYPYVYGLKEYYTTDKEIEQCQADQTKKNR